MFRYLFNTPLSLDAMRKMDGVRVYVFAVDSWAKIRMEGSYPLLALESGECISLEDWFDIQSGGIYMRMPGRCRRRPRPGLYWGRETPMGSGPARRCLDGHGGVILPETENGDV